MLRQRSSPGQQLDRTRVGADMGRCVSAVGLGNMRSTVRSAYPDHSAKSCSDAEHASTTRIKCEWLGKLPSEAAHCRFRDTRRLRTSPLAMPRGGLTTLLPWVAHVEVPDQPSWGPVAWLPKLRLFCWDTRQPRTCSSRVRAMRFLAVEALLCWALGLDPSSVPILARQWELRGPIP